MLRRLTVHNLALISDMEIEFDGNLNVFSGETGAGKSIIVDSLMLVIGARYDKSLLKFGEDKGFVEGVFEVDGQARILDEFGIDGEDGILIVTRKFFRDGRNEIRANGKQLTTAMLRELMQHFVDIYGQNEYQSLLKTSEQRKILDFYVFGRDSATLKVHGELYDEYKKVCAEMNSLGDAAARAQRIDILRFQIAEIENAAVADGEEDKLLERRHLLTASERIKNALAECYNDLDGHDGAGETIGNAVHAMSTVSSFGEDFEALYDRLRSIAIEADDIAACVKDKLDEMDSSEAELDKIAARLDVIRALKNKYGPLQKMRKFSDDAKKELDRAENGEEEYARLSKTADSLREKLYSSCVELSRLRHDGAAKLADSIVSELVDLGMPDSKFEVEFAACPTESEFVSRTTRAGFDEFEFFFSANAGQPLMPLAKIISGGEMSRFMLAIKLITGDLGNIDTMIFDEIDTGLSGAIGLGVAKKLCRLSRKRQVLCVTHLPQIAAMADTHLYIEKTAGDGETHTVVTPLDRDGQIGEVARLSGTRGVSATSIRNAEELKDWSDEYKREIS